MQFKSIIRLLALSAILLTIIIAGAFTSRVPLTALAQSTTSPDGSPYDGTAWALPGKVEAENYNLGGEGVAYHDVDAANQGGQYRPTEGVDIEATTDTGGGYNVGWVAAGEWLKYTVNVTTSGTYSIDFRVASVYTGTTFHLEVDTVNVTGTMTVPNTGGWQVWTTITQSGVNLTAGQHILRWVSESGNMNLNWMNFSSAGGATFTPTFIPATITPAGSCGTTNIALNKLATSSANENAGLTPNLAVDGNLGTRWSSAFSDPQWIQIDLGSTQSICRVILRWEAAYGKSYQIQVSNDATTWTPIFSTTTGAGGVETLNVSGSGRYIRMYGTVRGTPYGYSLWEFEVYAGSGGGTPLPTNTPTNTPTNGPTSTLTPTATPSNTTTPGVGCGTTNIALNKLATSSSNENAGLTPNLAVDGNLTTRWSSAFSDPQWIQIDLGSTLSICQVILRWENASGKAYQIQVSNDATNWTPIFSTTTGAGGVETLTVSGSGRYIRMYGTARNTPYGYSLWEFEVYSGTNPPTNTPTNTPTNGPTSTFTATTPAGTPYNWLEFGFNSQHSANNTLETAITAANVNTLTPLFQITLPTLAGSISPVADGAPAYLSGVTTANGTQDLLFVTTRGADLFALDAHTGAIVWSVAHHYSLGTCTDTSPSPCYTTASPAIDPGLNFIYTYGIDSTSSFVHKHAVGTGAETTTGGWPELATIKTTNEKGSADLTTATIGGTSYLYVANGGYPNDGGDYQGHLTTINLGTGAQNLFNTLCSNQTVHFALRPATPNCSANQSAVWSRAGASYDPSLNKLFIATGNGTNNLPATPNFNWGDSILALNPDGTGIGNGNPLDSYTPTNFAALTNADEDLGSTSPAFLPIPPGVTSTVPHLAVQSGKDAMLRLINLQNLSGSGGPGHLGGEFDLINVPQGGEVLTQPAVWVNPADNSTWVFVANDSGISGFQLQFTANVPSLHVVWTNTGGGTSPIIANNVLYYAGGQNLRALNPTTGALLWNSNSTTKNIGAVHWESPIVDNGVLYMTDENSHVTAYKTH